jgi:uncharacterized damage-inducible protein DinB
MAQPKPRPPIPLDKALLQAFATNERINQYMLENLDERAWRAEPPGGKGRTIAAIFAHIHNVRHMWLVVSGRGIKVPPKLDRTRATRAQARRALARSHKAMHEVLAASLAGGGRVKDFRPDVVSFFGYAVTHEAHHRGQICALARQVGHPLPQDVGFGMWDWVKRWRECGFT